MKSIPFRLVLCLQYCTPYLYFYFRYLGVQINQTDTVIVLLRAGASPNYFPAESTSTPVVLNLAVKTGSLSAMRILLNYGADLLGVTCTDGKYRYDERYIPPLISAIHAKNADATQLLLRYGASTPHRSTEFSGKWNPLVEAIRLTVETIANLVLSYKPDALFHVEEDQLPWMMALKAQMRKLAVNLLMKLGVNWPNRHGQTPLYIVCKRVCSESISFLLEHGSNASIIDSEGMTPLMYLADSPYFQDHFSAATLIRKTDLNMRSTYGFSVLQIVCYTCDNCV